MNFNGSAHTNKVKIKMRIFYTHMHGIRTYVYFNNTKILKSLLLDSNLSVAMAKKS